MLLWVWDRRRPAHSGFASVGEPLSLRAFEVGASTADLKDSKIAKNLEAPDLRCADIYDAIYSENSDAACQSCPIAPKPPPIRRQDRQTIADFCFDFFG